MNHEDYQLKKLREYFHVVDSRFLGKKPREWIYNISEVRKALNRNLDIYYKTNFEENLKIIVMKSFFNHTQWFNHNLKTFDLIKISNHDDKFIEHGHSIFADGDCETIRRNNEHWWATSWRLPGCRYQLYPRRDDGLAVLLLENIDIKRQQHSSFVANDNIYLIMRFCNQPFWFKMPIAKFFELIDLESFSVRELQNIWHIMMYYFYDESIKMRKSTQKREYYLTDYAPTDKTIIIQQIAEKAAYFLEIKGKFLKRTNKI